MALNVANSIEPHGLEQLAMRLFQENKVYQFLSDLTVAEVLQDYYEGPHAATVHTLTRKDDNIVAFKGLHVAGDSLSYNVLSFMVSYTWFDTEREAPFHVVLDIGDTLSK